MNRATEWPLLNARVKEGEGFLVDSEISAAISHSQLVQGHIDGASKYASYELHIGTDIHQLVLDRPTGKENEIYRMHSYGKGEVFPILPGETFKIMTSETLYIPADVFALVVPVGNIYKLGLSPETSFADPGFNKQFFLIVSNYSRRMVKLTVGDPIARVFFFKLAKSPDKIHSGNPRDMQPTVERVPRPDENLLNKENPELILERVLNQVDPPHFEHAFITKQVLKLRRDGARTFMIVFATYGIMVLLLLISARTEIAKLWPAFAESVLVDSASALVIIVLTLLIKPIRTQFLDSIGTLRSKA